MAEVKESDGKEKWQAIIKASHSNMTQTALTCHGEKYFYTQTDIHAKHTVIPRRAILFPPGSHPSDLSQSLGPFQASQLCNKQSLVSEEFMNLLWEDHL